MNTKTKHIKLAIADNYPAIPKNADFEQINNRTEKCGNCDYSKLLDTIEKPNFTMCLYRCTAKNCRKTLDTKIIIPTENCPIDKW